MKKFIISLLLSLSRYRSYNGLRQFHRKRKKFFCSLLLFLLAVSPGLGQTKRLQYGLAFDIEAGLTHENVSRSIVTSGTRATGLAFSPDGLKVFVINSGNNNATMDGVKQYRLSQPFDVAAGITFEYQWTVNGNNRFQEDIAFNLDGTSMYILEDRNNRVIQYTLSQAFDLSGSVTFQGQYTFGGENSPRDLAFSNDGKKMFIMGIQGRDITQFSLTNAFDVTSGVTADGASTSFSAQTVTPGGMTFSKDGYKVLIGGKTIYQYALTTAFDVTSTMTYENLSYTASAVQILGEDFAYSDDGKTLIFLSSDVGGDNEKLYPYSLNENGVFEEVNANDGQVNGQLSLKIYGETFSNAGGTLNTPLDYEILNLPADLTPTISVANDGASAVLTLSGNANDHIPENNISSLSLSMKPSAFSGNSTDVVAAENLDSGFPIRFTDNEYAGFAHAGDGVATFNFWHNGDPLIASYRVFRAVNGGSESLLTEINVTPGSIPSILSHTDNTVNNGTRYDYRVFSVDMLGVPKPLSAAFGGVAIGREKAIPNKEFSRAASFQGGYIEVPNNSKLRQNQGTVEFWIRMSTLPTSNAYSIASKHNSAGSLNGWNILHNDTELRAQVKSATSTWTISSGRSLADDKWHHVAFSYNLGGGGSSQLFIDGQSVGSETIGNVNIANNPIRIGRSQDGFWRPFNGQIDEFRIWDRQIQGSELAGLLASRQDGSNMNLVAVWNLDEAAGIKVAEDGGKDNFNGTLTGQVDFVDRPALNVPVFNSSNATSINEGTLQNILDVNADDGDGGNNDENITYAITGGTDAAMFTISSAGILSFQNSVDFENPQDANGNNTYIVRVSATDAELFNNQAEQTITVSVMDVDEVPVFTSANSANFEENSTGVVLDIQANDGDGGTEDAGITYTLTAGDSNLFNISASGAITYKSSPDFENPLDGDGNNVYNLMVTASDGALNATDQSIVITVTNTNDVKPVVASNQSFDIGELAPIGTTVGTLSATDADGNTTFSNWQITGGNEEERFSLEANTGILTTSVAIDFETTSSYVLLVIVSDGTNTSATEMISVNVTDEVETEGEENSGPAENDNSNMVPILIAAIGDQELILGAAPTSIDLTSSFADPENSPLSYAVSTSSEGLVRATLEGSVLGLEALAIGTVQVTITATDNVDQSVSTEFGITITESIAEEEDEAQMPLNIDVIEDGFTIFPNPASDWIKMENVDDAAILRVRNAHGQVIYETTGLIERIDISRWKEGMYFFQIFEKTQTTTTRIVIQR